MGAITRISLYILGGAFIWLNCGYCRCPMMPALETANDALDDAFASLAKMGVPSAEGKAVRDELVKAALQLHTQMTECAECEGCEEGCEGCDEGMEEGEEEPVPAKTS